MFKKKKKNLKSQAWWLMPLTSAVRAVASESDSEASLSLHNKVQVY